MERRKIIGAAMFSAAIAGGGVAGVVLGAPAASSAATSGSTTTTKPGDRAGMGMRRKALGLDATAKAIGVSTDALETQLKAGKTIADVAKAHNVPVATVIAAMVAAAKTRLEENLEKVITDQVNGKFQRPDGPGGPGGPHRGFGFRGGFGADAAAKAIGITPEALETELKAGKTIAEVAKAHNVAVATVVTAMTTAMKTELDAQVKAGRLTAEQAKKIEAGLTKMITDHVNGTFARPDFKGMHGGFGGQGFGGHGFGGPGGAPATGETNPTQVSPTGV